MRENIPQLDGNQSFSSLSSSLEEAAESCIPTVANVTVSRDTSPSKVPVWYEPYISHPHRPVTTRKTIRRDNKVFGGQFLPSFSSSNVRSIRSKLFSYSNDLLENEISVGFLQEIWEAPNDTQLNASIEEILETKGLKYISNPRHLYKRGGGAAIIADISKVAIESWRFLFHTTWR